MKYNWGALITIQQTHLFYFTSAYYAVPIINGIHTQCPYKIQHLVVFVKRLDKNKWIYILKYNVTSLGS